MKVLQQQVSKFERLIEKNSAKRSSCSKQEHSGRYMYDLSNPFEYNQHSNQNKKCVINLSSIPPTPTQVVLLAHRPNFAVTPHNPPLLECITAIELTCQSLNTNEGEDIRADIHRALRHSHPPRTSLRKKEWKAQKQLKRGKDHMVLTADKGVALVVMDRQECIKQPGPFWKTPVPTGPFQQIPPPSSRID